MSTVAQKASASALFSLASLEAAATRLPARHVADKVIHELRSTRNHKDTLSGSLVDMVDLYVQHVPTSSKILADMELLLRSKRIHTSLMEMYNPLYGMSEQERIRATARTVGLDVPQAHL
ncbi:Uncharacterized protein MSYG_0787 [Malassezia sympodialis ATCC 42132]|uniref:Uncharacterized protein n=1 Tax=Malassezia sympodialis (strain ATCC 42132) TaxID=1230383 RepID=A0A1M8A221_MALS4|nr:Uncharacterized protein MSYG_0787 [Malassezia sympodialis ATCC 42132]